MKQLFDAVNRSLVTKIFGVTFIAVHLPLVGLLLYLGLGNPAKPIPVLVIALMTTILGCLVAYAAVHFFVSPLERLVRAVKRYQDEGVEPLVKVKGRDEVRRLADTMLHLVRAQDSTLKSLERQANSDPLTGLGNRRWLKKAVSVELARAARLKQLVWVIVFDLDHFKQINDTHGHAAGDQVLRMVADVTRQQMRTYDLLARVGGEEFCVVAVESDPAFGLKAAERIRSAIETSKPWLGSERISVTASFGVHRGDPSTERFADMMRKADNQLYLAKARGRNLVKAVKAVV